MTDNIHPHTASPKKSTPSKRSLGTGHWSLVTALRSLVIGHWSLIFIFLFFFTSTHAQTLRASASRSQVSVGDIVEVTYELEGGEADLSDFRPPVFTQFEKLGPPSAGHRFLYQNGKLSATSSFTYRLRAERPGEVTLEPGILRMGTRLLQSNKLEITIGGASGNNQSTAQEDDNLFLRAVVGKNNVYVGEGIQVKYKIYLRDVDLTGRTPVKLPTYPGFWVENMDNADLDRDFEVVNGKQYTVATVKVDHIFPQRTGDLKVDELELICEGFISEEPEPFDPFGSGWGLQPFHKTIRSAPVAVKVLPLPAEGRPADFSGLVGNAVLSAKVDTRSVKANDPLKFTVTVAGEGAVSLLQPFKLDLGPDVEIYPPQSQALVDRTARSMGGTRTFTYTLIPHKTGQLTLPELKFSYFNPDTREYQESRTQQFSIAVEPASETSAGPAAIGDGAGGDGGGWLGFRGISRILKIMLYISFGLFMIIVGASRIRSARRPAEAEPIADELTETVKAPIEPVYSLKEEKQNWKTRETETPELRDLRQPQPLHTTVPAQPGDPIWQSELNEAESHLLEGNEKAFSRSVYKALRRWGAARSGLPVGDLQAERLHEALLAQGYAPRFMESYFELLKQAELSSYAPSAPGSIPAAQMLERAREILSA